MNNTQQTVICYFETLPAAQIDQANGYYGEDSPCCVGAHLAHCLAGQVNFRDGLNAWAKLIGGTVAHAIVLLRTCGAPHDPFGQSPWEFPVAEVFRRVTQIENLPSLVGADFTNIDFYKADLSGANLSGATFFQACLAKANLSGSNLAGANLSEANLFGANLSNADVSGANVLGAYLVRVNITGADLSRTDLSQARQVDDL